MSNKLQVIRHIITRMLLGLIVVSVAATILIGIFYILLEHPFIGYGLWVMIMAFVVGNILWPSENRKGEL